MPGISTHINFARLVLGKSEFNLDTTYFVLGTIAPDSANLLNDEKIFRNHHFMLTGYQSDLAFFLDMTRSVRAQNNLAVNSFIDGYYGHLWFDCFTHTHEEDLERTCNHDPKAENTKAAFKANVKCYDIVEIKDFLKTIRDPSERLHIIPGLDFISYDRILALWNSIIDVVKIFKEDTSIPTIVAKEDYRQFLFKATDEFAKELKQIS